MQIQKGVFSPPPPANKQPIYQIYILKVPLYDTTAARMAIGYPSRIAAALTLSAPGPTATEDPRNPTLQCGAPKLEERNVTSSEVIDLG